MTICFLAALSASHAQRQSQVELFCGVDLFYRDVNFMRLYDVLVNITPAVKWHMGRDWMFTAQGCIPVVDYGYGKVNKKVRMNMGVISKQLHLGANQHFKFSGGFFSQQRYGLDARWMFPINSWLMVQARAGYTGFWQMVGDATIEKPDCFTGTLGANVFLKQWNTEARLSGGRYIYEDYGVEAEVFRHFAHCSVGMFGRLHEKRTSYIKTPHSFSGGFKVVIMIPPYKKSQKKFVVRPASNFRTSYIAQSDEMSMYSYATDPEENARTNSIDVAWGTGTIDR